MASVTGVSGRYGREPRGTRAITLPDPKIRSVGLDLLGRCDRMSSCESALGEKGLATKLHLLNGELINDKLTSDEGRLARLLDGGASDEAIVDELYLRALGRHPRAEEREFWSEQRALAGGAGERRAFHEDFLWSLLTSTEFKTNH